MKTNYNLIVPSIAEQSIAGGLQMAGEKQFRKHPYRIEVYRSGLMLLRDGTPMSSGDDLPSAILKIAHDVKRIYNESVILASVSA